MWKDLTQQQKADLMDIYLKYGITSLSDMQKHYDLGGHIYSGIEEPTQQMQTYFAGELPEVTAMPEKYNTVGFDKIIERKDPYGMTMYYYNNPDTGQEEMLKELGHGKYMTMDERSIFDVPKAEAIRAEQAKGTANDFDKVMLGTLALGTAPITLGTAASALPSLAPGSAFWTNPITQQVATSTLMGEAANYAMKQASGKTWGENISGLVNQATEWNPQDTWWGTVLADMTNPFYITPYGAVSGGINAATNFIEGPVTDTGIDLLGTAIGKSQMGKRLIEAASQTADVDPIPAATHYLKKAWKAPMEEKKHLYNTLKYITTGKGNSEEAYFNDIGRQWTWDTNPETGYMRALLYGEEPGTGLTKLGTAADMEVGPHAETITQRGYKPEDVRVYTTNTPYYYAKKDLDASITQELESSYKNGDIDVDFVTGSFPVRNTKNRYDASGHAMIKSKDGNYVMGQDFTDFSYKPYLTRWLKSRSTPTNNNVLKRLFVKATDEATTPIIVRTNWSPTSTVRGADFVDTEGMQQLPISFSAENSYYPMSDKVSSYIKKFASMNNAKDIIANIAKGNL